jgi:hypothetical protein
MPRRLHVILAYKDTEGLLYRDGNRTHHQVKDKEYEDDKCQSNAI